MLLIIVLEGITRLLLSKLFVPLKRIPRKRSTVWVLYHFALFHTYLNNNFHRLALSFNVNFGTCNHQKCQFQISCFFCSAGISQKVININSKACFNSQLHYCAPMLCHSMESLNDDITFSWFELIDQVIWQIIELIMASSCHYPLMSKWKGGHQTIIMTTN